MEVANVKVEYVGEVRSLKLNPGDKVICSFHDRLPVTVINDFRAQLQKQFPLNEVLVIAGLESIGVIRAGSDVPTKL